MVDDNEVQQPEPEVTPAPEPAAPLFSNDPVPVGPVDVDLSDGGETAPAEAEAQPEPVKPKPRSTNRVPAPERINAMRAQLGDEQRAREAAESRVAALEQQNRELAARSQHVDASAFDAHDARIRSEKAAAVQAIKDAKARGDGDAETEALARLTEAASEAQAINAYKAQFPDQFNADGSRRQVPPPRQQPIQQQQPPRQQVQPTPQAPPPPELQQWVADNSWIDGRSPDHDPEMAQSATQFSSILDSRYNRSGRSGEIGGAGYLQELDAMLQQEYPDAYGQQPAAPPTRRPTMTRPNGAGVAPASRQAPTSQPGQPGSNTVRMTADEHEFALIQTRNGAYTYPVGHPRQGQRMDDKDGVRYHAEFIQKDRAMEPMRGKR